MRRTAQGAALLLASRGAGLVMGVVVFTLLARGLDPATFGVLATILGIAQMATTSFDHSLEPVQARQALRQPELEAGIVRWTGRLRLWAGLALALALVAAGPVLVGSDHVPDLALVLAVLPLGWLFAANAVLVRQRALTAMAGIALGQSALWLAAVAVLTSLDATLPWYLAAYVVSVAGQGLAIRTLAGRRRREDVGQEAPMGLRQFLVLMRPSAGLAVIGVAVVLYFKAATILLYRTQGPVEAGQYALAFRVLEQATILPLTLHNVFAPRMLAARAGSRELGTVFHEYVRVALLLAAPAVVVGELVAEPFVRILFGDSYADAVPVLRALLPAFVLMCLGYVLTAAAMSAGRTGRQVATALTALVVNLGLNLWLIPVHGARAAAAIAVATELVVVAGLYMSVRTIAGVQIPWSWLGRLVVAIGGATAAAVAVPSPLVAPVVFAAAYAGLLAATRAVSVRELRAGRLAPALAGGCAP